MLFRKDIDQKCAYCVHSGKMDEDTFLCAKRGVVAPDEFCRRFSYDPLKRIPSRQKAKDFSQMDELDFSL